jgi:Domain of unknown function (DUF1918)
MRAAIGDKIVVRGHRVGDTDRDAVILAVEGADGARRTVCAGATTGTKVCSSREKMRSWSTTL